MNLPRLRFKEFSEEWEVKELGNETKWSSGGTPSKQVESYWGGNIPWISASSMRGFKYFNSDLKITNDGLSNGSKLALKGSLLLLVRGSMLFNKIPVGIATKDVAFNQDVKSIKPKESLKSEFLLYWFLSSEHKLLNMVSGTGIGAGKLDTQDLLEMDLCIPTIPEQTKIVNFLTTVDEKIAQLTKTANLLARYKKGVMQQLFSQQLRFKDDDGQDFPEWKETTLCQVADPKVKWSFTGGPFGSNLKAEDYTDSGVRIIQLQNIGDGIFNDDYKIYTSEEKADQLLSCNIYPDEIIISKMGDPVARCCIMPVKEPRYLMASDGIRLVVDKST
jgi:type I restriction enzyme S subunit